METALPVNQVLLGDCVERMNALPAQCADMVFADPPYNLQLRGDLWRPNMTKVDAVDDAWDRFGSFAEYDDFTRRWLLAARRALKDTGTLWVIGSYHNIHRVGAILQDVGFWILNEVAWIKANPLPQFRGVRFCNAHETLLWAKRSREQVRYTFNYRALKAGNDDRQARSDWYFPVCAGRERATLDGAKAHATQKPEALLHRVLVAASRPGDLILDPFCGTGTTAAVAKRLGRRFITMDREEAYVRLARERVEAVVADPPEMEGRAVDAPRPRVSFQNLIESGRIAAGAELALRRAGITATVQADGTVVANGWRGSIHKVGALCLGVPSCNGWMHWLYREAASGEMRPLDDLRAAAVGGDPGPAEDTGHA